MSARGQGDSIEYAPWEPGGRLRAAGFGVLLRPLSPSDIDGNFVARLRDPQVVANLAIGRVTDQLNRARVRQWLAGFDNRRTFFLGVWPSTGRAKIGFCQARIDAFDVATITVAITDRALWRHGAAAAATYLLRSVLFDLVKVHKLVAKVYTNNQPVIRGLEEYGWVREGLLREAESGAGTARRDVLLYGMLRAEHVASRRVRPFVMPEVDSSEGR
jgi:RimJ/RimL family protein N-acetyltransferase